MYEGYAPAKKIEGMTRCWLSPNQSINQSFVGPSPMIVVDYTPSTAYVPLDVCEIWCFPFLVSLNSHFYAFFLHEFR